MKKVRSNQPRISINSCTELSKTQFLSVSIIKLIIGIGIIYELNEMKYSLIRQKNFIEPDKVKEILVKQVKQFCSL